MRVIAGRFGGRPLRAPKGRTTRPTADRVRQALFQVLGDLSGQRVLDLYAGTGALGIEALSRGAVYALFVEPSQAALACLRRNVTELGIEAACEIVASTASRARKAICARGPFDLVLCDPPWIDLGDALALVEDLVRAGLMTSTGKLVVEHPAREPLVTPRGLAALAVDRRSWGDTGVTIFRSSAS